MERLLKASGLQTAIILFLPFLLIVVAMYTIKPFENNYLAMLLGLFYVYPQVFILIYWTYYVSNRINDTLDEKQNLKRFNSRFRISSILLLGCIAFGLLNVVAMALDLPDAATRAFFYLSTPLIVGQLFPMINIYFGFSQLSKMINLKLPTGYSTGSSIFFRVMPFTIFAIQKRIRQIFVGSGEKEHHQQI